MNIKKKGNNYNIYIYEKLKKRVDPICALLKLDETHNGYNIYSGCFIMCGPPYEYEHICVCELYWFVVLVNNVSIPCKCICYKITEIVPAYFFTKCKATISRNILYKIHKRVPYTTGIIGTILYLCKEKKKNVQFAKQPLFMYIINVRSIEKKKREK